MVTESLRGILEQVLRETMPGLMRQMLEEALRSIAFKVADDGYMTTAEAAKWVQVDPSTIRRWVGEGHLRRYNAGREMRVSKSELRDFLGSRGRGQESDSADDIVNQIVNSL